MEVASALGVPVDVNRAQETLYPLLITGQVTDGVEELGYRSRACERLNRGKSERGFWWDPHRPEGLPEAFRQVDPLCDRDLGFDDERHEFGERPPPTPRHRATRRFCPPCGQMTFSSAASRPTRQGDRRCTSPVAREHRHPRTPSVRRPREWPSPSVLRARSLCKKRGPQWPG